RGPLLMFSKKSLLWAAGAAIVFSAMISRASAVVIADMGTDFRRVPVGQTSDSAVIPGPYGGSWHYLEDVDTNPVNGTAGLLSFQQQNNFNANSDGTAYEGDQFTFRWNFPILSDQVLFDNLPQASKPANSLTAHPGTSANLAV